LNGWFDVNVIVGSVGHGALPESTGLLTQQVGKSENLWIALYHAPLFFVTKHLMPSWPSGE
jgi:hypothetical protein